MKLCITNFVGIVLPFALMACSQTGSGTTSSSTADDATTSLLNAVRNQVGLTGSKEGCDDSECGACMMLMDGKPVNSCSYLALQAEGRHITTVEGRAKDGELSPLQSAFLHEGRGHC